MEKKFFSSKKEFFKLNPLNTVLTRPSNLPPKSKEEEKKHRKEIDFLNKLYEKTSKKKFKFGVYKNKFI